MSLHTRTAALLATLLTLLGSAAVLTGSAGPSEAATAGPTAGSAATSAGSLPPDQDPFYRAPANLDSYAAGQIVATRAVTPKAGLLPLPVKAWQLSFRSNDEHGRAILGVTTLLVPLTPWVGGGSRPVVSYQSPEDSVGTSCAPSYNLVSGQSVFTAQDIAQFSPYLTADWAVVMPDHEGPHAYFGDGVNSGQITLDSIRAVKSFDVDGVGATNRYAISGYSGGAQATAWAAQLQPTYAPDVTLVGAAIGGTPGDLAATARYLDGGAFSGFEFAAAYSLDHAFPEAGVDALLNARGRSDFAQGAGMCESDLLTHFAFRKLAQDTTVADPLAVPSVAAALERNHLGVSGAPTIPVYDYHANTDEIVPVAQDNAFVAAWRAQGTKVQEVRDPIGEHVEEAVVRIPSVVTFLSARFAGTAFSGN